MISSQLLLATPYGIEKYDLSNTLLSRPGKDKSI